MAPEQLTSATIDYDSKLAQLNLGRLLEAIGLCTCGTGTGYEVMLAVLERADTPDQSLYDPVGDLSSRAVEFIAHVMDVWGLLDHGAGIGGAWLTEDGELMLGFLRRFGTDREAWPEWAL